MVSGALWRLHRLDLPVRMSYEFNKFMEAARKEGAAHDDGRLRLLQKHGTPIEGTQDQFKLVDADAYSRELAELLAIEVDLPNSPITLAAVLAAKDGSLHAEDWNLLEPFIEGVVVT
jgi:hypothetical protein